MHPFGVIGICRKSILILSRANDGKTMSTDEDYEEAGEGGGKVAARWRGVVRWGGGWYVGG